MEIGSSHKLFAENPATEKKLKLQLEDRNKELWNVQRRMANLRCVCVCVCVCHLVSLCVPFCKFACTVIEFS
jgi:hypothetical protein